VTRTDHFSSVASAYAAYRPTYPAALFAYLAALPARRRRVWDCGAGSGQATLGLLSHFQSVVATDISRSQLSAATGNGLYRIASSAERAPLASHSTDLVIVAQALHWFDHAAFYAEVRRIVVPDGAIAVWSYDLMQIGDASIDAIVRDFYDGEVGEFWPPERKLVDDRYRGIPFPFDERPSPDFEMAADWTLDEVLGYVGTWSAVSRYRVARGRDPVPSLRQRLQPLWGARENSRRIVWPLVIRAARLS
jgi:SAM-dependent methyltransferase